MTTIFWSDEISWKKKKNIFYSMTPIDSPLINTINFCLPYLLKYYIKASHYHMPFILQVVFKARARYEPSRFKWVFTELLEIKLYLQLSVHCTGQTFLIGHLYTCITKYKFDCTMYIIVYFLFDLLFH